MLGTISYADLRRGTTLLRALATREITPHEFAEAAEFFQPEAAQVLATALALASEGEAWIAGARAACLEIAARGRRLS